MSTNLGNSSNSARGSDDNGIGAGKKERGSICINRHGRTPETKYPAGTPSTKKWILARALVKIDFRFQYAVKINVNETHKNIENWIDTI